MKAVKPARLACVAMLGAAVHVWSAAALAQFGGGAFAHIVTIPGHGLLH